MQTSEIVGIVLIIVSFVPIIVWLLHHKHTMSKLVPDEKRHINRPPSKHINQMVASRLTVTPGTYDEAVAKTDIFIVVPESRRKNYLRAVEWGVKNKKKISGVVVYHTNKDSPQCILIKKGQQDKAHTDVVQDDHSDTATYYQFLEKDKPAAKYLGHHENKYKDGKVNDEEEVRKGTLTKKQLYLADATYIPPKSTTDAMNSLKDDTQTEK